MEISYTMNDYAYLAYWNYLKEKFSIVCCNSINSKIYHKETFVIRILQKKKNRYHEIVNHFIIMNKWFKKM